MPLEEVPYIDYPELRINHHESTEMPFRYVKGPDGQPVMPEVHCPWNTLRLIWKLTRR